MNDSCGADVDRGPPESEEPELGTAGKGIDALLIRMGRNPCSTFVRFESIVSVDSINRYY